MLLNSFVYGYQIPEILMKPTDNVELISKVFENVKILEKILENVSTDAMGKLDLRLVNKNINIALLRRIRQEHRDVLIRGASDCRFDLEQDAKQNCPDCSVFINPQRVTMEKLEDYFRFLKEIAGVKVRRVGVEDVAKICDQREIHDRVINSLIGNDDQLVEEFFGMNDICSGSDECGIIGGRCRKYGPIQENIFDITLKTPHHFEHLEVSDTLLHRIVLSLADSSQSNLAVIDKYINSRISCDSLTLMPSILLGTRKSWIPCQLQVMRQIVELIVVKWNVKNLRIEFGELPELDLSSGDLDLNQKLIGLEFESVANYSLENLDICLEFSELLADEMEQYLKSPEEPSPIDGLISNVQKIFSTKFLTLELPKAYILMTPFNLNKFIGKFMRMIESSPSSPTIRNSKITVKLYPMSSQLISRTAPVFNYRTQNVPEILNSGARLVSGPIDQIQKNSKDYFHLKDIVSIPDDRSIGYRTQVHIWKGRRFCLEHEMANCTIDFEIYFEIEFLEKFFRKRPDVKGAGFLRHFWTPELLVKHF
ncbi:FTH domain-containing protein [Caenorhabditis elegans]|uniref:FTH domain-containing protein n=1 Tax=Caenorhabditis elegans TaxID=6239 RepID=O17552_CAEEL|nr:FTH domain-containing protein [Caenorhabditis elegans]CAB07545.2 FTH domain-containing protein [Caenorhabditis elegans]|eukprot:NP_499665.2 Uncharacterized protein CELE_BE10.3 [Caenorhabditis elegans]